jgi:hypothetical protein
MNHAELVIFMCRKYPNVDRRTICALLTKLDYKRRNMPVVVPLYEYVFERIGIGKTEIQPIAEHPPHVYQSFQTPVKYIKEDNIIDAETINQHRPANYFDY